MRRLLVVALALGWLLFAQRGFGAILVSESFANLNNDNNSWNDGTGWAVGSSWSTPNDSGTSWTVVNEGEVFSNVNLNILVSRDAPAAKGLKNASAGTIRPLSRAFDSRVLSHLFYSQEKTIYVSYLVKWVNAQSTANQADDILSLITFTIPNSSLTDDQRSVFIGMKSDLNSGSFFYTSIGALNQKTTGNQVTPEFDKWYLIVAELKYLGSNQLQSKLWAVDSNSNTWWSTEVSKSTITDVSDASGLSWRLNARTMEANDYVLFDELRIATTFEEAAHIRSSNPEPIPEPISAVAIVSGGTMFGLLRHWKKKKDPRSLPLEVLRP